MQIVKGKIPGAVKALFYGPEGIGKSTIASQFPDPVFIDTEGSTKTMDVARFEAPKKWEDIIECAEYVKMHPDCCKTLVIDTADWAEMHCVKYTCDKGKVSNIEDFGYGKGYVYLQENFKKLLDLLEEIIGLGIHVVVTAHAKMRKFEQPDEMGAYDRWEMKLSRQVGPMLKEWADMVLFANYKTFIIEDDKTKSKKAQGGKRVMYTSHHPCWDAKNRFGLDPCIDFSYEAIKDIIEPNSEPVKKERPKKKEAAPVEEKPKSVYDTLRELMERDGISDQRIRHAVSTKGAYHKLVKIDDYDQAFVEESLIAKWAGFVKYAKKFSDEEVAEEPKVPFD